jgi:hypothetical protein
MWAQTTDFWRLMVGAAARLRDAVSGPVEVSDEQAAVATVAASASAT